MAFSGMVSEYKMEWKNIFVCHEWTDGTSDR